jgi:hypothetical protein
MMATDIPLSALGLVEGDISKNQEMITKFQKQIADTVTYYALTLKPVQNGPFAAQYDISVQNLQLPKQIDLSL